MKTNFHVHVLSDKLHCPVHAYAYVQTCTFRTSVVVRYHTRVHYVWCLHMYNAVCVFSNARGQYHTASMNTMDP